VIDLDYKELVCNLTLDYANRLIGDESKNLEIVFSNSINGVNGVCYPFANKIIYCDGYMKLNRNNVNAIRYTVVEECAHLVRLSHDKVFYKICKDLGCDVLTPPKGTKFYWRYLAHCEKCGNKKYYHHKPRNISCRKCGNETAIITGNVMT